MSTVQIQLNRDQLLELEKIGLGALAPLSGFMTESEVLSVIKTLRLPTHEVFPLPVVLDIPASQADKMTVGQNVPLMWNNELAGEISVQSLYKLNLAEHTKAIFKTDDIQHPGVKNWMAQTGIFIGGPVKVHKMFRHEFSDYELTPQQTREYFSAKKWKTIAGFQTRNVPHRAHEYLQRVALEVCDGLFVQPLVGKKKTGDFTPMAVIKGYEALTRNYYPANKFLLGILSTAMRYAGPREAIFHALIRRNYGCTHFIIGRDHAGVGNYYGLYEAQELAQQYEADLGIQLLLLKGPYYCAICDGIATEASCQHSKMTEHINPISGTLMRAMLYKQENPDPRFLRKEVLEALKNTDIFIE